MQRHPGILWDDVAARLSAHPDAVKAIRWMEETGGEPDVIGTEDGLYLIADCAAESPAGRRSLCYDDAALQARKKNPPAGSAEGQARAAGVDMMTEAQYRLLQSTGEYDLKTSSWIFTPQRRRAFAAWAARCSASAVTTPFLCSTTARIPITAFGAGAVWCGCRWFFMFLLFPMVSPLRIRLIIDSSFAASSQTRAKE